MSLLPALSKPPSFGPKRFRSNELGSSSRPFAVPFYDSDISLRVVFKQFSHLSSVAKGSGIRNSNLF